MTERLLLDTDVVVEYLRGRTEAIAWLELRGDDELLLSVVTVAELFAGLRGEDERRELETFFFGFDIVPLDEAIARRGGLLRRDHGPGHGLGLPDALIAATAVERGAVLVTFDRKHFPMLENLRVPYRRGG
jgi:predicted nucleic acid-binding protein